MTTSATSRRSLRAGLSLAVAGTAAFVALPAEDAYAHGGLTFPATRTYACYVDGKANGGGGDVNPANPACADAVEMTDKYHLWNWFGNLISDAGGRHREIIPDGKLCGPTAPFDGMNQARTDWPTTRVQPGATVTFRYNAWAAHPGTWYQYVTRDGWDPSQPLGWDDLEPAPFDQVTNPPINSSGPEGPEYSWSAQLPNKAGRHIIYSIWQRSDSPEAFYNCSDVFFGSGHISHEIGGTGGGDDTQAPTAPSSLRTTGSTTSSISLAWNGSTDNVGVTGYDVYRGSTLVGTTTTTSFTVTGLSAGTSYTFTVRAKDAAGNASTASNALTASTQSSGGGDTQAPTAPTNLHEMGVTSSSVSLMWTASTDNVGVTGYRVFRGSTQVATVSGSTTAYQDTGLSADTSYSYTVRAVDAAGNVSAASDTLAVRTSAGSGGGGGGGSTTADWLRVEGNQIVDANGDPVWLTGANWFGYNASERVFHGLWSGNITEITKSMADRGINIVRVPISTQLLLEWSQGQTVVPNVNTYANPELTGMDNLEIFDYWLELCEQYGIKVMLDVHSAEADNSGHIYPMWYKGSITPEVFYSTWEWVTERYKDNDTIVAMDLQNEPHGKANESPRAKWDGSTDVDNWKHAAETAAKRILAINPNVLVLVEGIEVYPREGETWSSPNTDPDLSPNYYSTWWGGNLRGVKDHPIQLGAHQDQLVYSPHDYGPLVYEQPWFQKDFTKASLTTDVWRPNWLYLHEDGTAPLLVGEWGGRLGQDARQDKWMTALRDLIVEHRLHQTFWCINPNSGDTGGLLLDDWKSWDEQKYALLKPALWQEDGKFVSLDHQVPLGGANSTTGVSLSDVYGGDTGGGDVQAPTAPTNLRSTGTTPTSVSLAWNASSDDVGVTGYEVYRGTTRVGTPTSTSFTVTGLTADTSYSFTVRARDAAGNVSPPSTALTVRTDSGTTTDTQAPTAPSGVQVTGTTTSSVSLSWTASTDNVGVAGYRVYRGSTLVGSPAGTSFTDTGLSADTAYTYSVRAVDAAGNVSAASTAVTGRTQPVSTGSGCRATYRVDNQWGDGFTATVTVTNTGTSATRGWTVSWNYGGNQRITNLWNGSLTQSGSSVTVRNMSYNGSIAAGGNTTFGFQASFSGSNATPTLTCTAS